MCLYSGVIKIVIDAGWPSLFTASVAQEAPAQRGSKHGLSHFMLW